VYEYFFMDALLNQHLVSKHKVRSYDRLWSEDLLLGVLVREKPMNIRSHCVSDIEECVIAIVICSGMRNKKFICEIGKRLCCRFIVEDKKKII
jgi:hypothetical protein